MAFVGRQSELDLVAREIALAAELSVGRFIFVNGPAGAGKTALVAEVLGRIANDRRDVQIARGRCLQTFGTADPYLPFIDALKDLADESTPGSAKKEALSGLLTELAPYWLSVVPLVGGFLSATFATAAKLRGQAAPAAAPSREALFVQYLEVIKGLAQRAPLLLFLDDLHWADQASVALLGHLSRGIEQLPVAILCTFRSGDADSDRHPVLDVVRELERESIAKRVTLGELEPGAVESLMAAEFGGDVSEPLRRWMTETAGGNPLFVSELARLAKQSGVAVEKRGEWHLTEAVETFEVPRSAEAVIETRVQRLEPEAVRILQYASVGGNEFNSTVLAGLLETDELDLLDTLDKIERHYQLIQSDGELALPDGDTAAVYRFRHALAQTVLYKQVVGKRRVLLHRKAAELLESLFRDSPERVAGKLARHFHLGRVVDAAHRYARLAADEARRMYAHWEAEEFFRIALETSPDDITAIEIEERLGDVYDMVGFYDQGIVAFTRAHERRPDDPATDLRLRRKVATLERKAGLSPAPALLQRVRGLLEEATVYPRERAELLLELTQIPGAAGVIDAAAAALDVAEELGDALFLADVLQRLAFIYTFSGGQTFSGGETKEALPLLERAQELVTALGDPMRSALCYCIAGIARAKLGEYEDARRDFEGMLELCERLGDPRRIGVACNNLGAVLIRLGAFGEAEQMLQRARTIHERRDRATLVQSLFNLAERARLVGDFASATGFYQQLLERAREFEYWSSEAVAHAGLGLCMLEAGRRDEARDCAWRAVAVIADREEWFEDRHIIELLLARLEQLEGQLDAAIQRLRRTSQALAAVDVYVWAMVELQRTELLRQHDPEEAQAILLGLISGTRRVQSPLLSQQIMVLKDSFPLPAAPEQPA